MKRYLTLAVLLGALVLGTQVPVSAQFSAQIQIALQTLGIWPYDGSYADGDVPTWDVALNKFTASGGGGGGTFTLVPSTCAAPAIKTAGALTTGIATAMTPSVSIAVAGNCILTATASAVTSTVNVLPGTTNTLDIGSDAARWRYVNTVAIGVNTTPGASGTITLDGAGSINWLSDLSLSRLAADRSGQYRAANAQRADWCNTFTSLSSFECASADWQTQANVFMFGTRTAATGTGRLLNLAAQFDNAADSYTSIRMNASTLPVLKAGYLTAAGGNVSTGATGTWFSWGNVTHTNSSGVVWNTKIEPTVNQSGTAGYTASGGNVTETATGSGAKLLIDWRVNDVSQFSVSNTGSIIAAGSATLSAGGTFGLSGRNGWSSRALGLSDTTTTDGVFGIQINTGTAAPTFNNGTVTTGSRNTAGQITLTGANTGGVITFGAPAWTNAPFCTLTGSAATDTAHITAVTTTTLTIAGMTANGVFTYTCIGRI